MGFSKIRHDGQTFQVGVTRRKTTISIAARMVGRTAQSSYHEPCRSLFLKEEHPGSSHGFHLIPRRRGAYILMYHL